MSSSLSEQLKRLAVPQTSLLQRDKKRASLLFDPKEAGGLKRETVYQIGLDGLEELITKNHVFEEFKNNLFHISSKKFERAMETAESNRKLDKVIRKFLLYLHPYFLLSCAHKALEWLVNRYGIHEYNREDLLMIILPYHESNIFVRAIQIMKFKETNDSWLFLKSLQKPGVHLSKQSLLNHAANDVHFLKFVSKFMTQLIKLHPKPNLLTVAFNFYCTVYAGAIEYAHELNETHITQMLPTLLKGLNSDIPDYCSASFVILGRLVMKITLTDLVLEKFVEKIAENNVKTLRTETVLILLVLYQSQSHYTGMSEDACRNLVEKSFLPRILQELNEGKCFIKPFLQALVKGVLHGGLKLDAEPHREFLKKVLAAVKFDEDFIPTFLSIFLDATKSQKAQKEHLVSWLSEILETLERQYPTEFDKEVYKILSTTQQGKVIKRRKSLQKIFKSTMTVRCKFDVLDKLYHPNPEFRSQAIECLGNSYEMLRDREKEMIQSSFLDRLIDDDVGVVNETLNLLAKVSILESEQLKPSLITLAYKCQRNLKTWGPVSSRIILLLCELSDSKDWASFVAIFPYMLPDSDAELEIARKILKTPFMRKHPLLRNADVSVRDPEIFCNNIFDCLDNGSVEILDSFLGDIEDVDVDATALTKYLITLILSCILPENSPMETNSRVLAIVLKYFESCEVKHEKSNAFFREHLNTARAGRFHIEAFLLCVKNIILKTKKPGSTLGVLDLGNSPYFQQLGTALIKKSPNHRKYVQLFVNYFCETVQAKVEFLLNFAVWGEQPEFCKMCLQVAGNLVSHADDTSVEGKNLLVAYIIAVLGHKDRGVRDRGLKIVELYGTSAPFNQILEMREEILTDPAQIPVVISGILVKNDALREQLITAGTQVGYPNYFKRALLTGLSQVNSLDIFEKTSADCVSFLEAPELDEVKSGIVALNIERFDEEIAGKLKTNSRIWRFLEQTLRADDNKLNVQGKLMAPSVLLLRHFTRGIFSALSKKTAAAFLDLVIELATTTKNPEIMPEVRHLVKVIELDAVLLLPHFTNLRDVQSPRLDPGKLKRRISVVPTVDILDTLTWRKGVTALEFIQDKKKLRNFNILVPVLFEVLKKCLDFDEQAVLEYPKQLILSSIQYLAEKAAPEELQESVFNIELIVQCIRASQNPQTHYCALLLLSFAAQLFPSQVLHHIISIFTFMGSSLLRHEDAYSFQIISRIIDTIIPILVQDQAGITGVLRVFVDALIDVPEHRKLPIYKQLLEKIGVEEHLYVFLLLIFESHVNHGRSEDLKRLDIAGEITREFSPKVVIESTTNLIKYLKELPDEPPTDTFTSQFGILYKNQRQFRHFKYILVMFIARLLSSKDFVTQIAVLNNSELLALEELYKNVIVSVLTFIQRVSSIAEKSAKTPQGKYWKVLLHLSYDILDSINALLTPQMFLLVIKGLMGHNILTVRRRSLELLNLKLQNEEEFVKERSAKEIYALIVPLIQIIKQVSESDLETEEELLIQTGLLSLKFLVKHLVDDYRTEMIEILDFLTGFLKLKHVQDNVLASVLLCLGEFCMNLRAHSISSMPNFMRAILKTVKKLKHETAPSLLCLSCITVLQKILETLPLFLSPYLKKLLVEIAILSGKFGETSGSAIVKLNTLRGELGRVIPARVLIPVLGESYGDLIELNSYQSIGFLMEILGENLGKLTGAEINNNIPELTEFFLRALQFRAEHPDEDCNEVENQIVNALGKLILKLSERSFKPLYYKLYDWAIRYKEKSERIITFYVLSASIAESLKSLFVLFAGQFINNAAQVLDLCNVTKAPALYFDDEGKNILLLESVLRTLRAIFAFDSHKFTNKERFEILMQPLVDQLENSLGGEDVCKARNAGLTTQTLVELVVATSDDSLWKQLNYQILVKMKHTSPEIRLIALNCLKEIVKKLGVDYLPLLPETIPVLAELLEDEEEVVESACKKAVQEMEKMLGEPIEKYFKL